MNHPASMGQDPRANTAQQLIAGVMNTPERAVSDSSWAYAQIISGQAITLLQSYQKGVDESRTKLAAHNAYGPVEATMVDFIINHINRTFTAIENQLKIINNRLNPVSTPQERSELMGVTTTVYQEVETFVLEVQNTCFDLADRANQVMRQVQSTPSPASPQSPL